MSEVEKERAEIPNPAPVTMGGVRYAAVPWGKARGLGQNGGILAAINPDDGQELWNLRVYEIRYDPDMEGDKQDRHIESVVAEPPFHLRVRGERGVGTFRVDVRDRSVVRIGP